MILVKEGLNATAIYKANLRRRAKVLIWLQFKNGMIICCSPILYHQVWLHARAESKLFFTTNFIDLKAFTISYCINFGLQGDFFLCSFINLMHGDLSSNIIETLWSMWFYSYLLNKNKIINIINFHCVHIRS